MKKIITFLLCCAMLASIISCNKNDDIVLNNSSKTTSNTDLTLTEDSKNDTSINNSISNETASISEVLIDILQKQYTWHDFSVTYPQYEVTAQSPEAMNIVVEEFENVVFVFSGNSEDNILEYKMASVNAAGDVLLPKHFGKNFDRIIAEEAECASYVLSDDLMQHLYKYEDIFIYRDNFYYYIRGFRHSNTLTKEHIAMFLYDETHKRPW